jgi:hypothetical protein
MTMKLSRIAILLANAWLWAGPVLGQTMPNLPPPKLGPVPSPALSPAPGAPSATPSSVPATTAEPVSPGEMPSVAISAKLDQTEVQAGDPFHLTITVSWDKKPGGQTAELDFNFPDPPKSEGIRVTGNSFKSSATAESTVTHVVREYSYELVADKQGKLSIGETIVVYYRRGATDDQRLGTHPLEIAVGPPRRHLSEVLNRQRAKIIIALALALAAVGLAVMVLRDRRKKQEPPEAPTETLEDRYLRRLKDNETLRIAGRYADYFLGLSAVLKGYLHERHGIRTQGQTTDKIAEALKAKADQDRAEAVRSTLHLCDRVKFAGHQPSPAEMDRAYEVARTLIEQGRGLASPTPASNEGG